MAAKSVRGLRAAPPADAGTGDVERFLADLEHPHADAVRVLRATILAADEAIGEGIKWNVPSFRTGEWFATLHLRAKTGFGVILHFGAKKNAISADGIDISDPDGLLQWLAKDRALVAFHDDADVEARRAAFTDLLRAWIAHL